MTALLDRLADLFERGHAQPIEGLMSDARFADAERTADAAVLIAVVDRPREDGGPSVILTQRPRTMRDHPGQVAFPGGKLEPDETALAAALREAEEELALDPAEVSVIGTTDRYQTGTGFDITPVLGVVRPGLPLVANEREVESWFEAPLDLLMDARSWTRNEVFWKGAMREYLELEHAGYRIWGVTAAICYNLSRRLAWLEATGG
ncbi:CoA pyrophosphatase [Qipengyuania spongiae]|uniref:CoA pyrophosphatase n=1 Tax=Qipengyuania spongiae TaxID=2909673 RepID=A0ABY5SUV0_9SPHN|nr:CoA pyrophosphatase [Qipengyuania spongiae]UVI38333.1 CoA pyrophosphatase [Qipengyuania spongiae]